MPMKKMWVEWEDGADLSQSRKKPGGYSPLTRDVDNNLGHVVLSDVDEDEDEWQTDPEPVYAYTDERESNRQEEEDSDLEELLALVALGVMAAQKAAPHVRRWWTDQAVPFLKKSRSSLRKHRSAKGQIVAAESATLAQCVWSESSQEVLAALEDYRASMSSAEARERFVAALVARRFSDEQLQVLRNSRIEDECPVPEVARAIETVTPEQHGESIMLMLEADPSWPDEETMAALAKLLEPRNQSGYDDVLGRRGRIKRALRPPRTGEYRGRSTW